MIPYRMNPMGVTGRYLRRLDYLFSSTSQRIYTGLNATTHKLAYELEIDPDYSTYNGTDIIGNWNGTTRDIYIFIYSTSNSVTPFQIHVGQTGGTAGVVFMNLVSGQFSSIYAEADDQTSHITTKLNGSTVADGTFTGGIVTDLEMKLRIYTWKTRRFKIWQDDTLKRDFIPVLDLNGTECMYDLVENKFYYMR